MAVFKPLVRAKLADQITHQLQEAIQKGHYRPGDRLPSERELAGMLAASRVAVREALVTLQARGLIDRSHGRTARVSVERAHPWGGAETIRLPDNPSEKDVLDVKQLRIFLEIEMARIAARTCTAADAERLRGALEANRKAISDPHAFLATDMALHKAIAGLSGNALFAAVGYDLLNWLARFQAEAVHIEGSVMLSHREHARIIDLIIARDQEEAARAMFDHLSRTHQAYGRLSHSLQPVAEKRSASQQV